MFDIIFNIFVVCFLICLMIYVFIINKKLSDAIDENNIGFRVCRIRRELSMLQVDVFNLYNDWKKEEKKGDKNV